MVKENFGAKKILSQKKNVDLTCPDFTRPNLTSPELTCPDLTCPDLTCPGLTYPDLTYSDFTSPDLPEYHSAGAHILHNSPIIIGEKLPYF